ncbi:hypothetical protein ACLKA7_000934 [Drosophila subpalustris]
MPPKSHRRGGHNVSLAGQEDQVDLVCQLEVLVLSITRLKESLQERTAPFDPYELECRTEILNRYVDEAFKIQWEVDKINPALASRSDLEELCVSTKVLLRSLGVVPKSQPCANSTIVGSVGHHRKLPYMKLPKFSGEYSEYKNFIGLFTSLVDNEDSLSNVEKFNHLLSCLEKDALGTVKAFQVNDRNYPKALDALNRVYDNECLIFFEIISKLFDLPKMKGPSASSLRSLVDTVSAIYDSLLSLGDDKKIANAMLIHIVMNKVDSDTRLKWEETLDYTRIPLWKNCEESLNRRFQHLCAQEATSSRVKPNRPDRETTVRRGSKTALSVAQTEQASDPKCAYCKASNHSIHSCPSFESLPFISRFKFVKSFPLCLNCLKKGHNVSVCKSAHCRVCSKPHHTLLHKFVPESSALVAPLQHERGPETDSSSQSPPASCNHMFGKKSEQVILATALVKVKGRVVGVQELESAFLTVVSIVQQDKYCDEIKKIQKSIALQPSLQKLTPFVDTYLDKNRKMTLLRVGGRLLNAPLSHQAKFPLIMPKGCRFLARRGPVIRLHCDNATNFVGAARELKEFASHFIKHGNAMVEFAAQRGTEFAFIPPRAPHFGGLWEAAVKAAKHHLLRAIGGVILATDELQTVVVEVEAVLNSRPIVADSTNPNDVEAITPAHLLVGRTLATLPPASVHLEDDSKLCYLRRWRLVSAVKERFWASWSRDYLLGLQQKHRWTREEQNLEVDAVVLIHEDNVPSQNWLLGVVTDVVKGADGKVRVAVVRTKSGVYKRAIHRLAPLPKA